MTLSDAATVAEILRELSQRMELDGGNPYRARAYAKAADNLALCPLPLDQLIAQGRLKGDSGHRRRARGGHCEDSRDGTAFRPGSPARKGPARRAGDAAHPRPDRRLRGPAARKGRRQRRSRDATRNGRPEALAG